MEHGMHPHQTSWFQGWQITVQCAEFNCSDHIHRFASTAILKHIPPSGDCLCMQWPKVAPRSIVFPEDAFETRDEADADATSKARLQILALNKASTAWISDGG